MVGAAIYGTDGNHILSCVPTGFGKTLPMKYLQTITHKGRTPVKNINMAEIETFI